MREDTKIKIDFNLLMSGTWVLERKGKRKIHKFEKKLGKGKVIIYNALDVPSPLDSKVLDFLMVKAQENDWKKEIEIRSLRRIAKEVGLGVDKRRLNRLKRSFKILANTRIEFRNCFLDTGVLDHFEGEFEEIDIGIISDFSFKKIKARGNPVSVKVIFNDNFLALCKNSLGYKLIPFTPVKGLRDTAYALYKWAWRWFSVEKGYGERWIGNGRKLVEWYKNELNSTANYRYPSKVIERISSAIEQLNKNWQVPFYLVLKKEWGNYKIEIIQRSEMNVLEKSSCLRELPFFLKKAVFKSFHFDDKSLVLDDTQSKEVEKILSDIKIVELPMKTWEFLQFSIENLQEENEKKEILDSILSFEERDTKVSVAVRSSALEEHGVLHRFLSYLIPDWKIHVCDALDYVNYSLK